jgi:hypothetical protein
VGHGPIGDLPPAFVAVYTVLASAYYNSKDVDLTRANRIISLAAVLFQIGLALVRRAVLRFYTALSGDEVILTRRNRSVDMWLAGVASMLSKSGCVGFSRRLNDELALDEATLSGDRFGSMFIRDLLLIRIARRIPVIIACTGACGHAHACTA